MRGSTCHFLGGVNVIGRRYHRTSHAPGAPAVQSVLTRKSSGQEPILRNCRVTRGRKGTLRSDPRQQEEEPEKNATREQKTTSGAEKEAVTDPQTEQEQEEIETTSGSPREGRTWRQYPKTPTTLWEERGLRRCVDRVKQNKGGRRGARREGKHEEGQRGASCFSPCFVVRSFGYFFG
ncbi:hypothetical protein NDU88_002645 [Pleurodeles waltl]|uniref:Uncharacterized protein n=1 Tax=Pleurodeles waltl TaxID=8319 RepID=A0AAV7NIH0_PLEWA|nr:hypothetical protein NDU88_002645 [Pleurodeles waltl]